MRLELQELEDRCTPTKLVGGVLIIAGTVGSDTIVVRSVGDSIIVEGKSFPATSVQRIEVQGNGGYDIVRWELPGYGGRLLQYGLFGEGDRFLMRSRIGDYRVSVGVSSNVITDAYFSMNTSLYGRSAGGFILDVGDPELMEPPPPGPDEDGDLDDYAEIQRRHDADQSGTNRVLGKKPSAGLAKTARLDQLMLKQLARNGR